MQAAFELYLAEMGRLDKVRPETSQEDSTDSLGLYPRLAIGRCSALSEDQNSGEAVYWLPRSLIMEHTVRRRARTDHFNHALLLCRSGMPWNYHDSRGGHLSDAGLIDDEDVQPIGNHTPEFVDVGFRSKLSRDQRQVIDFIDAGVVMPRIEVTNPLDPALPNVATVGGITALTRSVLGFTPFVESLSLTGFLDRVIAGLRSPPSLTFLRSVTLGPPINWWISSLSLDHATLATVEKLRICGRELSEQEMGCVAGKNGALPNLRQFQWSHLGGFEQYRWT